MPDTLTEIRARLEAYLRDGGMEPYGADFSTDLRHCLAAIAAKDALVERLVGALDALIADFEAVLASPEQLEIALDLARSGRPAAAPNFGEPETIHNAREVLCAVKGGDGE